MTTAEAPRVEHLMEYLYQSATGLVQTDLSGAIQLINPVAVNLLMPLARKDDFLDDLFLTLEPFAPDLKKMVERYPEQVGMVIKSLRISLPSGTRGHRESTHYSLSLTKVDARHLMASIEDVSAEVRRELLLNQQDAWINAMMAGVSRHAMVMLGRDGSILRWNPGMAALFGLAADDVVGQPYGNLFPGETMTTDRMHDRLEEVARNGLSVGEGWMQGADGRRFWGHTLITAAESGDPSVDQVAGFQLLVRDISDHRESMDSLLRLATSDQLTGLANRRAFYDAADLEMARYARKPRAISLLLIDIDHFKLINDTHGHPVGDQVIRDLADVMLRSVRGIDAVARLGGEEFAVLLPSTDVEMACQIAERIRSNVAGQALRLGQLTITYRVSIGVAKVIAGMVSPDDLIAHADKALYAAKRNGRDRVCVYPLP